MRFGLMFRPGHFPLAHVVACLKVAEDVGFTDVWFGDSHLIWHEVGPHLTVAAMSTTRLRVGPLVSNPVTRHPTVVASMLATLGQLFEGRAALGIGRGDSAVRALCRGEEAVVDGVPLRFSWLTARVPVLVAAYGPRVLELAGAEADGLILQLASPSVCQWALGHAQRGRAAAGRPWDGFEVVAGAPTYVSADRAHARARVRGFPATVSNHVKDLLRRRRAAHDERHRPDGRAPHVDRHGGGGARQGRAPGGCGSHPGVPLPRGRRARVPDPDARDVGTRDRSALPLKTYTTGAWPGSP